MWYHKSAGAKGRQIAYLYKGRLCTKILHRVSDMMPMVEYSCWSARLHPCHWCTDTGSMISTQSVSISFTADQAVLPVIVPQLSIELVPVLIFTLCGLSHGFEYFPIYFPLYGVLRVLVEVTDSHLPMFHARIGYLFLS